MSYVATLETCRRLASVKQFVRHEFQSSDKCLTFTHLEVAIHALSVCLLLSVATYDIMFWCRPVYYKKIIL